jgi:hypothetical protein
MPFGPNGFSRQLFSGGSQNNVGANFAVILGGQGNVITGLINTINGQLSVILGGSGINVSSPFSLYPQPPFPPIRRSNPDQYRYRACILMTPGILVFSPYLLIKVLEGSSCFSGVGISLNVLISPLVK